MSPAPGDSKKEARAARSAIMHGNPPGRGGEWRPSQGEPPIRPNAEPCPLSGRPQPTLVRPIPHAGLRLSRARRTSPNTVPPSGTSSSPALPSPFDALDSGDSGLHRGKAIDHQPIDDHINVPFCAESRLSGIGEADEIHPLGDTRIGPALRRAQALAVDAIARDYLAADLRSGKLECVLSHSEPLPEVLTAVHGRWTGHG